MSNYRVRETGGVHTQGEIRRMNPNVSLPRVWTQATMEVLGVDPILEGGRPEPAEYEVVVRDEVKQVDGNWTQTYKTAPMFTATADATVEEQIAAYEARRAAERRATMACTPRQARLALASQGLYEAVQTTVVAISDEARIEWEYATTVERTSPLIDAMKGMLGMTDEDLDNLFELAVTL